uniref:Reverse transcriptase domain-containing protein n=1 Tax=Gadus morhua TaxID=8049 RepID=A0A8C5B5M7_GADMO
MFYHFMALMCRHMFHLSRHTHHRHHQLLPNSGTVPPPLKLPAVTPLLKKPGLDSDDPNNFRPISNLTFLSKLLKRAVATQLNQYLLSNINLYETFQSGFRTHHSTETALLKVTNDLLLSSDSGSFTILLLLLDLSAAFDTVNHSILLSCLQSIGITDSALSWFTFYLSERFQYISINNHKSHTIPVSHGVPQGSVLGPILFILYMLPLGHIIPRHGLQFHCYADDTKLYITTTAITPAILLSPTVSWTSKPGWTTTSSNSTAIKLKLSSSAQKKNIPTYQNFSLCIDGHSVTPSPLVSNLGIIMDPTLSFKSHINSVRSFFHLCNIARLRPTLSSSAAETLIHAFITCRLDYCNSILYGLPSTILQKLQYVQKTLLPDCLLTPLPENTLLPSSVNSLTSNKTTHQFQDSPHHLQNPKQLCTLVHNRSPSSPLPHSPPTLR